ncbi:hypothetical protein BC835DRAFT_1350727 [Cytidiella melzeri]|nr:hypothetical protein BC835DRAFT_1350727 [Cytidiella melzeri]
MHFSASLALIAAVVTGAVYHDMVTVSARPYGSTESSGCSPTFSGNSERWCTGSPHVFYLTRRGLTDAQLKKLGQDTFEHYGPDYDATWTRVHKEWLVTKGFNELPEKDWKMYQLIDALAEKYPAAGSISSPVGTKKIRPQSQTPTQQYSNKSNGVPGGHFV